MKTIFKKSLVALALTGAAMSANATITITGLAEYSQEGITKAVGAAQEITLGTTGNTNAPVISSSVAVPVDGLIRVNFSAPVSTKSGFTMNLANAGVAVVGGLGANPAPTMTVANYGADFVVYRVTVNPLPANATITLTGLRFISTSLVAANGLTLSASTETALGASVDAAVTETIGKIVEQKKFEVLTAGRLDKTIDVAKQRKAFTAGTTATLVIKTTDDGGIANAFPVAYTAQKYTLEGDLSFLKDTDATTDGIQSDAVTLTAGCTTTSLTAAALKFSCNGTTVDPTVIFNITTNTASKPDADVAKVLNATNFKLTAEADFNNPAGLSSNIKTPFASTAVGSWELNGSDVQIPYMVFGTVSGKQFSQVININNASSIEGDIYVDVYAADGTALASNKKLATKAKANTVTAIQSEVKDLIGAYNGRASVRVIAEVPSASTQIYAAYVDNVTTERAVVVGLK